MVAHDFAAHQTEKMVLQTGDVAAQAFHARKRQFADFAVFQRDAVAAVGVGRDAIQPQKLARHMKAGDLLTAVMAADAGFEKAGAHGKNRLERLAGAEQILAALEPARLPDDGVQLRHFFAAEAHRQAKLAQTAIRAGHLKGVNRNIGVFNHGVSHER